MYKPQRTLSENRKTGRSLNLPIAHHCTPTKNCSKCCYGRSGPTALPSNTRKQIFISNYLKGPNLTQLIQEAKKWRAIRLSGIGDLLSEHVPNILKLADSCPQTIFWGMTRKIPIAKALNNKRPNLKLLLSIDASSPKKNLSYKGPLCFGPRLHKDKVPDLPNLITVFPYHSHGQVVKGIPEHPKDCQAVYHRIPGCLSCNRCWDFIVKVSLNTPEIEKVTIR